MGTVEFVSGVSSHVGDVVLGAEDLLQLTLVVVNIALHDLHAGAEQSLKRLNVQDCKHRQKRYYHSSLVFVIKIHLIK